MMLACSVLLQAVASPVTQRQAQLNAQSFLHHRGKAIALSSMRQVPLFTAHTHGLPPYYIFNVGDGQGYVIASGDDCTPAVLGYADSGSVGVGDMPENMQWWLDEYARQIRFAREHDITSVRTRTRMAPLPAIEPLLSTWWDQTAPFNRHCPLTPAGTHYVTGCEATAMAQVLYYHHANSVSHTTHEMPAYYTQEGVYVDAIPAGLFIDWGNMLDLYWHVDATEEQMDAVAWLMRYCGSAVHMQYSIGASSARTTNVASGMIAYFNYSSRTMAMDRDHCGLSDEEWEDLIYDELSNSRPVLYSGYKTSQSGHAFVCDGYDGEGYFHINWGWTKTEGYYLLTAVDSIDAPVLNYNLYQQAVIHAEPRQGLPSDGAGLNFVDPIARALSLSCGDVDDDGVLTMDEVLAVREMGPFEYSCLSSFDEFQYFTGVTSVSNRMFADCESLASITLHDNITSIGKNAFNGCRRLKEFTVPCSVTVLGFQAFLGCDSLRHLIWNARNCGLEYMAKLPYNLKILTIGDSTVMIPNGLAKDSQIRTVTMGKSVVRIGSTAFSGCTGLKNVVIPNSVTTIAYQAFSGCTGLKELVLGDSVSTIGDNAFSQCSNLKSITIPNAVTSIGSSAFKGCANLRSVVIGKSVSVLKTMAFAGCDSLKTVTCLVPAPVSINESVFKDLYARATLRVPAVALDAYKAASPWNLFADIVAIDPTAGDVDLDGVTGINDVTALINRLLVGDTDEYDDVNCDGHVNINDVVAIIERLLSGKKIGIKYCCIKNNTYLCINKLNVLRFPA